MLNLTPVVRTLLVACLVCFGVDILLNGGLRPPFALWPLGQAPGMSAFQPWQLITYSFLHGDFTHLLFNMFALYMFGSEIERLLGSQRFAFYWTVCVISAAVLQLMVQHLSSGPGAPTVGASGGIFGLLLAYGMAWPHRKLMLLFPPIPMPAWVFVTGYGLLELYLGVFGRGGNIAHFAHVGGMIGGFVLLMLWRNKARQRPRRG
jgi:membrane associated rhomboid family serine protease